MSVDVIFGGQRGDEGKGGIVNLLAEEYSMVARYNGGPNAGHSIMLGPGNELSLHLIPCGITYPNILNIVGAGVFVDPISLATEISKVEAKGFPVSPDNLRIDERAHLILPHHIGMDKLRESGVRRTGSTGSGISYVAGDYGKREGVRAELLANGRDGREYLLNAVSAGLEALGRIDYQAPRQDYAVFYAQAEQWLDAVEYLKPYIDDTNELLHYGLANGEKVLAEGAQGYGLDINYGPYDKVTSSNCGVGGAVIGLGIAPSDIGEVTMATKALRSSVGGDLPVTYEPDPERQELLRGEVGSVWRERGKTTGRDRDMGYYDLVELSLAVQNNKPNKMVITKLDQLPLCGATIPVAIAYELDGQQVKHPPASAEALRRCKPVYEFLPNWEGPISHIRNIGNLPPEARHFAEFVSGYLDVEVSILGVGPYKEEKIFI